MDRTETMEWYTNRYALMFVLLPALALPIVFAIAFMVPRWREVVATPFGAALTIVLVAAFWLIVTAGRLVFRVGIGEGVVILQRIVGRKALHRGDVSDVIFDRPIEGDTLRVDFSEMDSVVVLQHRDGKRTYLSMMPSGLKRRILKVLEPASSAPEMR